MNEFDSIVVGGGIGGLISAAMISAEGRSVALFEKNPVLGGCCSSFSRAGYRFDSGTSSLSGLRDGGMFRKILDHLQLPLSFHRPEIRETLVTPRFSLQIPSDPERFRASLLEMFHGRKDTITRLFELLDGRVRGTDVVTGRTLEQIFQDLQFDDDLRLVFEALLGNIGLPASRVDGATGLALIREYVLDGGYYPKGGMKTLPNAIAGFIESHGGKVLTGHGMERWETDGNAFRAIQTESGVSHRADACVAAMDVRQWFYRMRVTSGKSPSDLVPDLSRMVPSTSAFMVFLGLNGPLSDLTQHPGHLLYIPEGNMADVYRSLVDDRRLLSTDGYVYIIVPSRIEPTVAPSGGETVCLFVMAPYRGESFWRANRKRMIDALMARAEKLLPGLSTRVAVMDSATPLTIERYTGGTAGATYGWEATVPQSGMARLSAATSWPNLFLAGHWTRPGSGISAVAYSGFMAGRMVTRLLREEPRVHRN